MDGETADQKNEQVLSSLRKEALDLISGGKLGSVEKNAFTKLLGQWRAAGGSPDDVIVRIGESVYDVKASKPTGGEAPMDGGSAGTVRKARIRFDFLQQFMVDVFVAIGVPVEEAKVAAEVLIWADRHGVDSHGIGRLVPIYVDRVAAGILKPTAPIQIVKETDTTAVLDGGVGLGLYIGPYAMKMCLRKAKKMGLAMVVVRNSTHYGAAGYYADMATQHGCICVTGTNARPSIAPTYGVQPMLGTNPMTWGMPSDDGWPFLIDCATSITQRGKIEKYAREGLPTPPGQVVDRDGRVRTDTEGILKDLVSGQCSLAPLGGEGVDLAGYKGYSYAVVVELLSSSLCEGTTSPDLVGVDKTTGKKKPMPLGHWFIAIDIERFVGLDTFKRCTGSFLRKLRESDKSPNGPGRIWTAGEPEHDAQVSREEAGGTLIPEALMKDMINMRERFPAIKKKYPKFDFEEDQSQ